MDIYAFNISASVADMVKKYASVWETVANIHFKFVPYISMANVKIGFDSQKPNSSKLGRRVLYKFVDKYTMNLQWTNETKEEEFKRNILHEFGHVLGFIHEHQSPAGGIQWDTTKVFSYLTPPPNNLDRETIRKNVFEKYSSIRTNSSIYDSYSIMHYYFPPGYTTNSYFFTLNSELSKMDKDFAKMVYPHPFEPDNPTGTLLTGDDCDSIDFTVEYYVAGVDPLFIDFILEPGTNQQGKPVSWWKRIGIPLKGGVEMDMEIEGGSVSNKRIQVDLIDKTKGMSFSKAKLLGVHTPLSKKWNVFPALRGGCRVRLTWRNDTCQ